MAGTRAGGLLAAERNRELYGDDFYARVGKKGGSTKTDKPKGFAATGLASAAGKVGGTRSRRKPREK